MLSVWGRPGDAGPGEGRWWRGLDSNQCTLSGQIYSLMDLTTLPPLHNNVAWVGNEALGVSSGRFMVVS
jgi:hypothetical protein